MYKGLISWMKGLCDAGADDGLSLRYRERRRGQGCRIN